MRDDSHRSRLVGGSIKFDFVIFTPGRAGSHLLATLLNSHPEIMCEGEFGKDDSLIDRSRLSGVLHGCILAFGQRNMLFKLNPSRVIYMTRSPVLGAESYAKNVSRYRARIAGLEYDPNPKITDNARLSTTRKLENIHKASCKILKTFNYLEVSYEELTDNKSISWMPMFLCNRVCDFLGVGRMSLWTDLVKRK